eukprot:COSAG02_NODE_2125_length_9747_cov_13.746683_1_plen_131_part_00
MKASILRRLSHSLSINVLSRAFVSTWLLLASRSTPPRWHVGGGAGPGYAEQVGRVPTCANHTPAATARARTELYSMKRARDVENVAKRQRASNGAGASGATGDSEKESPLPESPHPIDLECFTAKTSCNS